MSIKDFLGFNPHETEGAESFESLEPIPEGEYKVIASRMERKNTKKGDGMGWAQELTVIEGDHSGRVVKHWYNIHNPNEDAERIGRGQMKRFLECIGTLEPEDEDAMLEIPLMVYVVCKNSSFIKDGREVKFIKNEISRMAPIDSETVSSQKSKPSMESNVTENNAATKKDPPWAKKRA